MTREEIWLIKSLGEIKIKSPLDTFKETFTSMKESLGAMVGLQTKEAKRHLDLEDKLKKNIDTRQLFGLSQ